MAQTTSSAKSPLGRRPLVRALRYLGPYRLTAFGAFASLVMVTMTGLLTPRVLQWAIDEGIVKGDLTNIRNAAIVLVAVAALRGGFTFLQGYWSEIASQGVAFDLRNRIYDQLQRLSFAYHDQAQTGQLMTRVTSDVEVVRQFVGLGFLQFLSALVMLFGSAAMLLWMDWQLALAALAVIPFILLTLVTFIRRIQPRFKIAQERLGVLNTRLQENIAGARIVRAFAAEGYESARYTETNDSLLEVWLGIIKVFATSFPLIFFLSNLGTLIVFWIGGMRVIDGRMTVGELVAFNAYLALLLMPLFILGGLAAMLSRANASAARVFEVMDAEIEVADKPDAVELASVRGAVEFDDVTFRYVGADKPVLQGVSFAIEPGQTVALLGLTGSGKSTVINLIPRFYDVDSGRVLVDGHDVRDVTLDSLRPKIGMVLQEPVLFSGSLRDNIAYGRPDASPEEIDEAAHAAQVHQFVDELPDGYDTEVGERGVGLSGGQKQRIAIARAILVDPSILIFDDSTSAVDAETESLIHAALDRLLEGRTAIVIAQRVSTVREADRILVLEGGEVAADGTHDELLATSPLYCDIVASQLVDDEGAESISGVSP